MDDQQRLRNLAAGFHDIGEPAVRRSRQAHDLEQDRNERFYGDRLNDHEKNNEAAWWKWERFRYVANFESADLTDAGFEDTSVAGASFKNANLKNVRFFNSDISRAEFDGATNLDLKNLEGACYGKAGTDRNRSMPRGLSTTFVLSMPACPLAVPVDDPKNQTTCPQPVMSDSSPRETATR